MPATVALHNHMCVSEIIPVSDLQLRRFGEQEIVDHISARPNRFMAVIGDHDALLIYDRASQRVVAY